MFNKNLKTEIEVLKHELKYAKAENERLRSIQDNHEKDVNRIKELAGKIEKERDELKNLVRDQTGADLLINALESIGITKSSNSNNLQIYLDREASLQQIAAQARSYSTSIIGQACGGLGYPYFSR